MSYFNVYFMKRFFLSSFFFLIHFQVILAQDGGSYPVFYLRDANANFTIDSLLKKNANFKLVTNPSFGHDHVPYWFKVSVKNLSDKAETKMIEVDYAYLDEVNIFVLKNKNIVYKSPTIGWQTPYANRLVKHYNPIFPIEIGPKSEQVIYIRSLRKTLLFVAPVRVRNEERFYESEVLMKFFWGIFGGITISAFLLGIILFIYLRQNTHLYYSLYVITSLMYVFLNKGMFLEYYQSGFFGINGANIRQFLLNLECIFILLFIREYLFDKYKFTRILKNIFNTFIILNIIAASILGFDELLSRVPFVVYYYTIVFLTTVLFSFYLVFYNIRHKIALQESRIYIIAISPLVILSVFSIIRNFGIIPNLWLLDNEGIMLCFLLEILVLSVGLGIRYKSLRDEKELQQRLVYEGKLNLLHERESISRDLHDNVGSQLSIISSSLDNISYLAEKQKSTSQKIEVVGEFVREAISSLRDTIWATHKEIFSLSEFRAKVYQYILKYYQSIESCQITVDFEDSDKNLSSSQALNLFRIIQEAINNAIKHAQATKIILNLSILENQIFLKITNNGIGFDLESKRLEPHFGILNMQKRVSELGGKLEIKSDINEGTSITISILST